MAKDIIELGYYQENNWQNLTARRSGWLLTEVTASSRLKEL